jgi:signal transduction histidine kinase
VTDPTLPVKLRKKVLALIISQKVCLLFAGDLLDEYTLSQSQFKVNKEFIDKDSLCNFIMEVILLLQPLAQKQELRIEFNPRSFADPKCSFALDTQRFQQVLLNLLQNAYKFSLPKSFVEIDLQFEQSRSGKDFKLCLAVIDRGIGIPDHE